DATLAGIPVALAVMDFEFMGGSMGSVVGEKITRAAERALAERKALVIVAASGGARMQEGTIALMQLAKTVAAVSRLDEAGLPFVSVLADPTTGGVLASFASLGDLVLAEPGALIGFSGARVTSETIGEKLPKGYQRAEFQLQHGFVDQVVPRAQLKERIAFFLNAFRIAGQDMRWSLCWECSSASRGRVGWPRATATSRKGQASSPTRRSSRCGRSPGSPCRWRATSRARTRSISSDGSSITSRSCTGTAGSAMTPPSWAASASSPVGR